MWNSWKPKGGEGSHANRWNCSKFQLWVIVLTDLENQRQYRGPDSEMKKIKSALKVIVSKERQVGQGEEDKKRVLARNKEAEIINEQVTSKCSFNYIDKRWFDRPTNPISKLLS